MTTTEGTLLLLGFALVMFLCLCINDDPTERRKKKMDDEILELSRKIDLLISRMNSLFFEIGDLRNSQYSKNDIVYDLTILKDSLFDSFEKMNNIYLKYYDE